MNYELLGFLIILLLIIIFERKNFKREGIVFLRRTKKGIDVLKKWSSKHEKAINLLADFGVVLSFGAFSTITAIKEKINKKRILGVYGAYILSIISLFYFTNLASLTVSSILGSGSLVISSLMIIATLIGGISAYAFFTIALGSYGVIYNTFVVKSTTYEAPLQIVLPFSVPESYNLPVFSVPLDMWLISLLFIVVVHESAHAIVALANKIKVKSMGYGVMLFLPLGFAEPDEKDLKKASKWKRLRVYGAGSTSNFLSAFLLTLLFFGLVFPYNSLYDKTYEFKGISYNGIINTTYAYETLPLNGTITHINNTKINNFTHFIELILQYKPNETIKLTINNYNYTVKLSENPQNNSLPFIGIKNVKPETTTKESVNVLLIAITKILEYLLEVIKWIIFLSIGIGIANLIPLIPLDGGLMAKDIFSKYRAYYYIGWISFILLMFSIFGVYIISFIS